MAFTSSASSSPSSGTFVKSILVPLLVAGGLYTLLFYGLFPLYRRYRSDLAQYSHYIPLGPPSSYTNTILPSTVHGRVTSTIAAVGSCAWEPVYKLTAKLLPALWTAKRRRRRIRTRTQPRDRNRDRNRNRSRNKIRDRHDDQTGVPRRGDGGSSRRRDRKQNRRNGNASESNNSGRALNEARSNTAASEPRSSRAVHRDQVDISSEHSADVNLDLDPDLDVDRDPRSTSAEADYEDEELHSDVGSIATSISSSTSSDLSLSLSSSSSSSSDDGESPTDDEDEDNEVDEDEDVVLFDEESGERMVGFNQLDPLNNLHGGRERRQRSHPNRLPRPSSSNHRPFPHARRSRTSQTTRDVFETRYRYRHDDDNNSNRRLSRDLEQGFRDDSTDSDDGGRVVAWSGGQYGPMGR